MLRVVNIRLDLDHDVAALRRAAADKLGLLPDYIETIDVRRRGIDARKRGAPPTYVYTVDVAVTDVPEKLPADVRPAPPVEYQLPGHVPAPVRQRPVVVGAGPCGLLAAIVLAEIGLTPLVLERGKAVEDRVADVDRFWNGGELDPESNAQFGEGGAGTFSDGKLTTQIKERANRCRKVLQELVRAGAPESILYDSKPHLGTDVLRRVVRGLRRRIEQLGGEVRFGACVDGLAIEKGRVRGLRLASGEELETDAVVLAIGHSARDTFTMLEAAGVDLESKPFAIGVRIEHPQALVDRSQYGEFANHPCLGAADYKLVHHPPGARSVYTFCMCPGGAVMNASTEVGGVVTNGMSTSGRDGPNANSALLVGVGPEDFGSAGPLSGVAFQREWERRAFEAGGGGHRAPVQRVGDFLAQRASASLGEVASTFTPGVTCADLHACLPTYVAAALRDALPALDRKLRGFAMPDAVMTAIETRTSSPVRILRNEHFESIRLHGLYPAGEGAGYAGGITSSAVDGIKVAEAVFAQMTENA